MDSPSVSHMACSKTPWRDVVLRMLAPDPRERFQRVSEVVRALDESTRKAIGASTARSNLEPMPEADLELDATIRELQTAPRPLLAVVWVLASFVSAAMFVFEAALLPLVYQLVAAFSDSDDKSKIQGQQRKAVARIKRHRRQLATLSRSAEVVRDKRGRNDRR